MPISTNIKYMQTNASLHLNSTSFIYIGAININHGCGLSNKTLCKYLPQNTKLLAIAEGNNYQSAKHFMSHSTNVDVVSDEDLTSSPKPSVRSGGHFVSRSKPIVLQKKDP